MRAPSSDNQHMARSKKVVRKTRKPWSAAELKQLRQNAGKKTLKQLAKLHKRTPAAVQIKASVENISLRLRDR
jgi:hypothetical protein